jgi:hypothetical protein
MGSFDKSYYDILNKYRGIIKEGMGVRPVVYKKQGNDYVPANDLDLKVVPPELLFTKSEDPTEPFVPYVQPDASGQTNPVQAQQPTITMRGSDEPMTSSVNAQTGARTQQPTASLSTPQSSATSQSSTAPLSNQPSPTTPASSAPLSNVSKKKNPINTGIYNRKSK